MNRFVCAFSAGAALAAVPAAALAQWSENFDSYAAGARLDNVGGWAGWDNVSSAAGTVSAGQALSGPHSIEVSNSAGNDAVHPFSGYTSGVWTLTAHQYIPTGLDALTYFIVNNEYNHGGPHDWAIEMHMDPVTGLVNEQLRDPTGGSAVSILYDRWVEIRIEIDLSSNAMQSYYNNQLIASGSWNADTGLVEIQNLDLYAPHNASVYYDNISLVPAPASVAVALVSLGGLVRRRR